MICSVHFFLRHFIDMIKSYTYLEVEISSLEKGVVKCQYVRTEREKERLEHFLSLIAELCKQK